jgi:hypothetical protein
LDRQTFEALPTENQVAYMNERSHMKLKESAEEIGIPPSSLSQLFLKAGYVRKSGIYSKDETKKEEEQVTPSDDLHELLQYKEKLIEMVLQRQQQEAPLDFSVLSDYKDESGKIPWSTLTFQIPTELHAELDEYLERRGYKKQFLLSLLVKKFLDK